MSIWSAAFWKATSERMVRGAGIGGLLYLGNQGIDVIQAGGAFNAFDLTWGILGYMLGGALLSLLFSLAGNVVSGTGPSFNQTEVVSPPAIVPPPAEGRRTYNDKGGPEMYENRP